MLKELGEQLTLRPAANFDSATGERLLKNAYGVAALDGFGNFSRADLSAAGALIGYLDLTQKGKRPALKPLKRELMTSRMTIDAPTRRNLELTETLSGERRGSLLSVIDKTVTAAARVNLQAVLPRRSPIPRPLPSGSTLSLICLRDARFAKPRARICAAPPISRVRWGGFLSGAAARAIWR